LNLTVENKNNYSLIFNKLSALKEGSAMPVRGRIIHFRLGAKSQNPREVIVEVDGVNDIKEANKLIHHKVIWKSDKGLEIRGVVKKTHGKKGRIIVRFRKPLPGQAIGTFVIIL